MVEKEAANLTARQLWSDLSDPPELALARAVKLLGLLVARLQSEKVLSEIDVLELRKAVRADVVELK